MKNKYARIFVLLVAAAVLLSACGSGGAEEEVPTGPQIDPSIPALEGVPGNQDQNNPPGDYPAPEAVVPPAQATLPADYPTEPPLPPTPDPYPGGVVWVLRPIGIQCEDGTDPGYGDLREAKSTLTAAGVKVAKTEMTDLMVTTSCGSPTSAHFRFQIAAEDLQTALSLGWTQE